MAACFGRRLRRRSEDLEALLPEYDDETGRQQEAHRSMHLYQMLRALGRGFMPTNVQTIIFLRSFIASEFLRASNPELSSEGRYLLRLLNKFLHRVLELLRHKNSDDQLQRLIWSVSRISLVEDAQRIKHKAARRQRSLNASAAYQSVRTIGGLFMTNGDFRVFCTGLATVGQHVTADTAQAMSRVVADTGDTLQPDQAAADTLRIGNTDHISSDVKDAAAVAGNGLQIVKGEAQSSLDRNMSGDTRKALVQRLKAAVASLRQRPDYNDSVTTIATILQRWAKMYSRAASETLQDAADEKSEDENVDLVLKMAWSILTSFGDAQEWHKLEDCAQKVLSHANEDPSFEETTSKALEKAQKLLTDPSFYDHGNLQDLWPETDSSKDPLQADLRSAIEQFQATAMAVSRDEDVQALWLQASKLSASLLNQDGGLWADVLHVVLPSLLQSIHCIPIPRIECSVPGLDLLLENLILEPGQTVNASSFLPFSFKVQTCNDYELRKAHTRNLTSSLTSVVTFTIQGLSLAAKDIGYWCHAKRGLLNFVDQGLAGFHLDERGIDISLDVEVGKERLEEILTLRKVRVKVHRLTYELKKSKFSCLAWVLKPLFRPLLRKMLERQLAIAIADLFHAANRELVFARERLRATRISDPQDVRTFLQAVMARLTPADDPDLYTMVGVKPSSGLFKGVYAPGSIVKLWEEEGQLALQKVDDGKLDLDGWKNSIFDISAVSSSDAVS